MKTAYNGTEKDLPIVYRHNSWHRPLLATVNDKSYEISRMFVHNGEEILLSVFRGWLEHIPTPEADYVTRQDILGIDLPKIRLARKLNLTKCDHFIIKFCNSQGGYHREGYALYLYVPEIAHDQTVTKESDTVTEQYDYGFINLPFTVQDARLKEDGESGVEYFAKEVDCIRVQTDYRSEKTADGIWLDKLTDILNGALGRTNELSTYQVEKLLKVVNIEVK